jgi:hypothetical protein
LKAKEERESKKKEKWPKPSYFRGKKPLNSDPKAESVHDKYVESFGS